MFFKQESLAVARVILRAWNTAIFVNLRLLTIVSMGVSVVFLALMACRRIPLERSSMAVILIAGVAAMGSHIVQRRMNAPF